MVEYTCERCLCVFNKKSNYQSHLNRKNKCKQVEVQKPNDDEIKLLVDEIKSMKKEMFKMRKTIETQNKTIRNYEKCNVDNSTGKTNNTTNNIDNSTNKTTNNITNVIAFGKEDLVFISDAKYKQLMNRGYAAPSAFTEHVHLNKNKPEFHNLYISNKKDKKYIHVYDGEKWVIRFTKDVIEELKINASELIKSKIDLLDPHNKQDAAILKKINRFIDSYDNDDDCVDNFDEHYELMFYNNRQMVKNTHNM